MISFTIPGRPVPKQRPRVGKNGSIYTPKKCREYEKVVAIYAKTVFRQPLTGPVALGLKLYFSVRPGDLDNYVKAISDGLNRIAWVDDRQVVKLYASLQIGQPERAEVIIQPAVNIHQRTVQ